jgi:hypothetical protein
MKALIPEEVERGIYIDFEGGGSLRRAFLGVLVVEELGNQTETFEFTQYLLEKELRPSEEQVGQGIITATEIAELTEVLKTLKERAESEGRLVFAYSEHEKKMIAEHLQEGSLLDWWENPKNLVNARPIAKRWKTLRRPDKKFPPAEGQKKENHSLANYLELIELEVPPECGTGMVASAIDLVRNELKGGTLSKKAQVAWNNALQHNWYDCYGMYSLMKKCALEAPRIIPVAL